MVPLFTRARHCPYSEPDESSVAYIKYNVRFVSGYTDTNYMINM
jgi:hypothetical protein